MLNIETRGNIHTDEGKRPKEKAMGKTATGNSMWGNRPSMKKHIFSFKMED